MNIVSIQVALFSKNNIDRPDYLMNDINSELNSVFDEMPTISKLPDDVPFDVPVLRVHSKNGEYGLKIAKKRSDLLIFPKSNEDLSPLETFNQYTNIIERYYKCMVSEFDLVRIGIITSLFQANDNNIKDLYEKHITTPYSTNCTEFYLRTNEPLEVKGLTFNNVKIVEAGELSVDKPTTKGVLIQLDTNSAMDNSSTISASTIGDTLDLVLRNLKNIKI